jgi:hypothetical protein
MCEHGLRWKRLPRAGFNRCDCPKLSGAISHSRFATCPLPVSPIRSAQPQSQTAIRGYIAVFHVTTGGSPALSYQWTKNGTAIASAVEDRVGVPAAIISIRAEIAGWLPARSQFGNPECLRVAIRRHALRVPA